MLVHNFQKTQQAELESWFSDNPLVERDKKIREIIRYPLILKQMGLDQLDTTDMLVWDVGAGPYNGVSTLLRAKRIERYDPLAESYREHYPLINYFNTKAEDLDLSKPDLLISTNAIDHFESPELFMSHVRDQLKPGGYFAHIHAINNAYSHQHEAHAHNVNPEMFNEYLRQDFEIVWSLDYQRDGLTYSWRKQPAFAQLWRKTSGY